MTSAETPADKVLQQIQYRLQTSRDRREREVLKLVLLAVGITSISNNTNRNLVISNNTIRNLVIKDKK